MRANISANLLASSRVYFLIVSMYIFSRRCHCCLSTELDIVHALKTIKSLKMLYARYLPAMPSMIFFIFGFDFSYCIYSFSLYFANLQCGPRYSPVYKSLKVQ